MVRLVVIVMMVLTGCASVQPVIHQTDTVYHSEVIRDTVIAIEKDSTVIQALFECDSMNMVILNDLYIAEGKTIIPTVEFKDRVLTIVAEVDSQQVYLEWKEDHVFEVKTFETIVTEVQEPPWWKQVQYWIATAGFTFFLAILFIKMR